MKKLIIFLVSTLFFTSIYAKELPKIAYKQYPISYKSDKSVHALVIKGAELINTKPVEARKTLVKAITKVSKGAKIDKYDYLKIAYGLLETTVEIGNSDFILGAREDYINVAKNIVKFLDKQNLYRFKHTKVGALQLELCREANNGLAWLMLEDAKKLKQALSYVNRAVKCMRGAEDNYILDTKVRILLKMKKSGPAYYMVRQTLKRDPSFEAFEDIVKSKAYKKWLNRH